MENQTNHGLKIPAEGALDFVSLGALVHRLDPGIIPFRKATECLIHVSGGEFNCAANLADCFGLRTGIVSAASTPAAHMPLAPFVGFQSKRRPGETPRIVVTI